MENCVLCIHLTALWSDRLCVQAWICNTFSVSWCISDQILFLVDPAPENIVSMSLAVITLFITVAFVNHSEVKWWDAFQNVTVATTECSVQRRVERGVREVPVTPLTVPVSVYRDGNHRSVLQVHILSLVICICRCGNYASRGCYLYCFVSRQCRFIQRIARPQSQNALPMLEYEEGIQKQIKQTNN